MFQSRFNHHPYSLGVFFRFLSPLELAKLSCRHRRTDLARTDVMSENLPKSMPNRKVHCNLSNQYHRIIIYIYIYLCLFYRGEPSAVQIRIVFCGRSDVFPPPRLVDEVRDALEDDDSEASHIELAQEIIKSHADWNGSSSDSDLWDKITEASHSLAGRSLRVLIRSEVESPEMA